MPAQRTRFAICQEWEMSYANGLSNPVGYSLHLSMGDWALFRQQMQESVPIVSMGKSKPSTCPRPNGEPYQLLLEEPDYHKLMRARGCNQARNGLWGDGQIPTQGKDGKRRGRV